MTAVPQRAGGYRSAPRLLSPQLSLKQRAVRLCPAAYSWVPEGGDVPSFAVSRLLLSFALRIPWEGPSGLSNYLASSPWQ